MRAYLDHASTSPPRPEVVDAMVTWLGHAADPGRVHTEGRMVRAAIEDARASVAGLLGLRPREVIFTSGATESANAAIWAAAAARPGAIVSSPVEHSCVREAAARTGRSIDLPVDGVGRISLAALAEVMEGPVALVNCQWGNHEVGTRQPVDAVVRTCREAGVLVHVDAAQAVGRVPLDLGALGADLVSVSAHKFGGPPGVGALIVRRGLRFAPFVVGGDQERARRGGMENVPAIVGMGVAASCAPSPERAADQTRAILDAALAVPGVVAYGDLSDRLPHIVCLGVEGVEAEAVLLGLDQAGVAAHSGSSCASESLEPSPVLEAMGVDAQRSLRLSVGWSTTDADVAAFAAAFGGVVGRLRALGAG
ncbi:MAG: cysteine desulfurase family protein [Acidimicrobiales bacterium]